MGDLEHSLDDVAAATGFSGVVRVDRNGGTELAKAFGMAHRGWSRRNEVTTRFAIASGTKPLTALVVAALVEEGRLDMDTTARSVLGADLPLIDQRVTVEHLLAHRSGIGDYFDEEVVESMTDYVLPVPVHRLVTTSDYLSVLDGHPQQFSPGERFAYNNSGFVVLALLAERVSGTPFAELVRTRVCEPAGMRDTGFLRSDEPAERMALGYLSGRACGPTSCTCRSAAAATAGSTPRRRTSPPCGRPCTPAGSCRGSGWRTWCVRTARCRPSRRATGSASGCVRRVGRSSWSGATPECRSRASTTRERRDVDGPVEHDGGRLDRSPVDCESCWVPRRRAAARAREVVRSASCTCGWTLGRSPERRERTEGQVDDAARESSTCRRAPCRSRPT
jgi:CubicO group peptidase (beta-lactamase class C family)